MAFYRPLDGLDEFKIIVTYNILDAMCKNDITIDELSKRAEIPVDILVSLITGRTPITSVIYGNPLIFRIGSALYHDYRDIITFQSKTNLIAVTDIRYAIEKYVWIPSEELFVILYNTICSHIEGKEINEKDTYCS